jgi:hypothetical protein
MLPKESSAGTDMGRSVGHLDMLLPLSRVFFFRSRADKRGKRGHVFNYFCLVGSLHLFCFVLLGGLTII